MPDPTRQERVEAQMDWIQVALIRRPPCFHVCEDGNYCGRADRWDGHRGGQCHEYISLDALLDAVRADERERCARVAEEKAEAWVHGHGVSGNPSHLTDEEFERALDEAGKGCTVCARIEELSAISDAIRALGATEGT